jgi:hypothetical protein
MVLAAIEAVYASIQVPVVIMVAQFIQDNAHMTQTILNVAIVFLVEQMMEEMENVYFLVNAMELVSEENVLEEMISNAALIQEEVLLMEVHLKINTLAHA